MVPERIHHASQRRLVGLCQRYTHRTRHQIPVQWSNWEHVAVTDITEDLVFGVCMNFAPPDQFDYMCALPVGPNAPVPPGQTEVVLAEGDFAVYVLNGHVSGIAGVFDAVMCGTDIPIEGWRLAHGPQLEVYGPDFDGLSGTGRIEIWFPVKRTD
jgi:AraC family transcriptional regulator